MGKIKGYLKIVAGSLIIAITLNVFFKEHNLLASGFYGVSLLLSNKCGMNLGEILLVINLLMLILGFLTLSKKKVRKSLIVSLLVPLFIYLTSGIGKYIDLQDADLLLITIFGGVLIGFGSSLIYKENRFASLNDMTEAIAGEIVGPYAFMANYVFDLLIVVFAGINFGLEMSMYSTLSIIIIEIISKKSVLGISDSKVFYIITKKERAVKRFILNDLHYDITIFEVTGGYSHNESKILMSAIPTKDYYKLREGIKEIDPEAFISITDSYEIINNDKAINKSK